MNESAIYADRVLRQVRRVLLEPRGTQVIDTARIITALDRAALQPEDWPRVLEVCRAEFDAKLFSIVRIDADGADLLGSPELTEAHLDAYHSGEWYARDPRAAAMAQLAPGKIATDASLVPLKTRNSADFYRDFATREDVPHMAGWRARSTDGGALFVSLLFGAAHGPLRTRERLALAEVQERATSAIALSQALTRARERGALDGLALTNAAAVGLDERGRVTGLSAAGAASFNAYFDLGAKGDLRARTPDTAVSVSRLLAALSGRDHAATLTSFLATTPDGKKAICSPVAVNGAARDLFCRTRAILLLRELDQARVPQAKTLQTLYSLTPAEAAIAICIAAGEAPAQIAMEREISIATVRTVLRHVFRKTGVNRQSELAALLAQLGC